MACGSRRMRSHTADNNEKKTGSDMIDVIDLKKE
jgi:hypothetical protein